MPLNLKGKVRVLPSAAGKICWMLGFRVYGRFKEEEATARVMAVQRL